MWIFGQASHHAPLIQKSLFLLGGSVLLIAALKAALVLKLLSLTEFTGALLAFLPDSVSDKKMLLLLGILTIALFRTWKSVRQDNFAKIAFLICVLNAIGFAYCFLPAYLLGSGIGILLLVKEHRSQKQTDNTSFVFLVGEAIFAVIAIGDLALISL